MSYLHYRGFTLLEMLITLTIVGVMISLAVPAFSTLHKQQQTRYITKALNQTLSYARLQAINRNETIIIEAKENNWQKGWIIQTDREKDKTNLRTFPQMPLEIKFNTSHGNKIQILPDGTTDGFQSSFEYGGEKLNINRGGRTRLE